jgi:hypothetical protein
MATRGQRTRPLTESGDGGTYVSAADTLWFLSLMGVTEVTHNDL